MTPDLDTIEAALVPQYDQYGRGASEWHDNIEVRARLEWLPALVAEVRALRAVAEAAQEHVAAEKDTDLPRIGRAHDAMESALDAWRAGGGA